MPPISEVPIIPPRVTMIYSNLDSRLKTRTPSASVLDRWQSIREKNLKAARKVVVSKSSKQRARVV